MHVRKAENVAKIWLEPEPSVAFSYGMTSVELTELCRVAKENKQLIREFWNEYFSI